MSYHLLDTSAGPVARRGYDWLQLKKGPVRANLVNVVLAGGDVAFALSHFSSVPLQMFNFLYLLCQIIFLTLFISGIRKSKSVHGSLVQSLQRRDRIYAASPQSIQESLDPLMEESNRLALVEAKLGHPIRENALEIVLRAIEKIDDEYQAGVLAQQEQLLTGDLDATSYAQSLVDGMRMARGELPEETPQQAEETPKQDSWLIKDDLKPKGPTATLVTDHAIDPGVLSFCGYRSQIVERGIEQLSEAIETEQQQSISAVAESDLLALDVSLTDRERDDVKNLYPSDVYIWPEHVLSSSGRRLTRDQVTALWDRWTTK